MILKNFEARFTQFDRNLKVIKVSKAIAKPNKPKLQWISNYLSQTDVDFDDRA